VGQDHDWRSNRAAEEGSMCVCVYTYVCVVRSDRPHPSEVIPHYMFMLSLGFTSEQPSLVHSTPLPVSHVTTLATTDDL